ncbi:MULTISPECIES: crotonase/enoyl-CoA hydratase family protein [unclassified Rathayibacter]|uniref:crotonase/enoyl-CoA hydratase family protein n=1 Tax=unclassified Rathayibacter TaxID=2609250 RepID=UPI00188B76CC|nr:MULTISPECIES: crotonase/enoyl-CoA hydratase family protein [unclassified Rathayibacter]MBF4462769.1 crotonase/enoyl-CoA hydratase family protein [Rathayibacter sp. VKM Ac-2879]MBF4504183.1 crotonase/enoyl-CoA hydratase family protein [Rathayibacter sp. VKM Ac-2878]
MSDERARVRIERRGHVLAITLDRPEKRNAADFRLLRELAAAYGVLDADPELRAGVVLAAGEHFTAGLDLADIGPRLGSGELDFVPEGGLDPWALRTRAVSKPVVVGVQGTCLTLGIELALASDIVLAEESTRFGQIEVARGIVPFGGATVRFPRAAGWGDAMRWILTGELFDAAEAHRIGLVQEVVPDGSVAEAAYALAARVAAQAPLAVQAALANARLAVSASDAEAAAALPAQLARLAASDDARIGLEAFISRTTAEFTGR